MTPTPHRHPALAVRTVCHAGVPLRVRRAWPVRDGSLALAVELVAADGSAIGALAELSGALRVLDDDDALSPLSTWRSRPRTVVIAHRPAKRAVARVITASGPLFVKIASTRATGRAVSTAGWLSRALRGQDAPATAAVRWHDEEQGELGLGAVPGVDLPTLLRTLRPSAAHDVGHRIGRTLAAIARVAPTGVGPHTAGDEASVLDRWIGDAIRYGAVRHAAADDLRRRGDRAIQQLLDLPVTTPVLAHRDLHDGQVLIPADPASSIGILDWDTASAAPAALDLGNLLAHLDRLAVTTPVAAATTRGVLDGATAARHRAMAEGPDVLTAWRTAAAVRIAAVNSFRP